MKLRLPIALATLLVASQLDTASAVEYVWAGADANASLLANWKNTDNSDITGTTPDAMWASDGANHLTIGNSLVTPSSVTITSNFANMGIGGLTNNTANAILKGSDSTQILSFNGDGTNPVVVQINEVLTINSFARIDVNADLDINIAENKGLYLNGLRAAAGITIKLTGNKTGEASDGNHNGTANIVYLNDVNAGLEADWEISGGLTLDLWNGTGNSQQKLGTGKITIDNGSILFSQANNDTITNDFEIRARGFFSQNGSSNITKIFTGNFSGTGNIKRNPSVTAVWIFTGDNSGFSGDWIVAVNSVGKNTFQFGNGGTFEGDDYTKIAGTGKITGSLETAQMGFNYSSDIKIANAIQGALTVNHAGTGVLEFTNTGTGDDANNYEVATLVTGGGTLRIGTAGQEAYGTGHMKFTNGSTLDFDSSITDYTFAGTFDLRGEGSWKVKTDAGQTVTAALLTHANSVRTGSFVKTGEGTLIITSGNLLTDNAATITVEAGTLQLTQMNGADATVHGRLVISNSNTQDISNDISGTGIFGVTGGGVYTLSGTNSHSGGTTAGDNTSLYLANDSAAGTGNINLGDGAVLASSDNSDRNITGGLTTTGETTLGVSGTNTGTLVFAGPQVVMGGDINILADTIFQNALVSGTGTLILADGINLSVSGLTGTGTGLSLGDNSKLTFLPVAGAAQYLASLASAGTGYIDFASQSDIVLTIDNALMGGGTVILDNYNYNGTYNYVQYNNGGTSWTLLDDIKIKTGGIEKNAMLNASGQVVEYDPTPYIGDLVVNDAGYQYTSTKKYYGSMAGENILTFTREFTFAPGADPVYGFTTVNDSATGTPANSFTVDSLLANGPSNQTRSVSVIGQAGQESRTVTFGNTGNSFTGNLSAQNVTIRAVADVVGGSFDASNVTTLGHGNTIQLSTQATLLLDTAHKSDGSASGVTGPVTYHNNIQLGQNNTYIRQISGAHTLTGNINLIGVGEKAIENAVSDSNLTLTGTLSGPNGSSALILKTLDSSTGRIILALTNENSSVQALDIQGYVDIISGKITSLGGVTLNSSTNNVLALAGGTLAAKGHITGSGSSSISLGDNGKLQAIGDLVIDDTVSLDGGSLGAGQTFQFDTNGYSITLNSQVSLPGSAILEKTGSGELLFKENLSGNGHLKVTNGTASLEGAANNLNALTIETNAVLHIAGNLGVSTAVNASGKITGDGSIITSVINFGPTGEYAGDMTGQIWDAGFSSGSAFSGRLNTAGNITFENGSRLIGSTALDTSQDPAAPLSDPQLVVTNGGTVTLSGLLVSGDTTTDQGFWAQGEEYSFTLIQTDSGNLYGRDGDILSEANLSVSASLNPSAWGTFLTGTLDCVDGEQLIVILTRNARYVSDYALTHNQLAVSTGIDSAMDNYQKWNLQGTEMADVIKFFNAMGDNIGSEAPAALNMLGGLTNFQALAGQRTDLLRHVEAVRQRARAVKGINILRDDPANQFWFEATQSYNQIDNTTNSPGFKVQTWGGAIGVDYLSAAHFSLGVSFAYSNINVHGNEYSARALGDAYYIDLYGHWEKGPWSGVVVITGGTTDFDVKRNVVLGDRHYNIKGSPSGKQVLGMAEVSYAMDLDDSGLFLAPHAGLAVGTSQLDGYTEKGFGNAGLNVSEQKMNIIQGIAGVRLYRQNIDSYLEYETSRWELRAAVIQEMGDKEYATTSRFISTPGEFQTKGADIGQTGFMIGGGFSKAFDSSWSVFGDVNAEFRNGNNGMNSTLGIRCTF